MHSNLYDICLYVSEADPLPYSLLHLKHFEFTQSTERLLHKYHLTIPHSIYYTTLRIKEKCWKCNQYQFHFVCKFQFIASLEAISNSQIYEVKLYFECLFLLLYLFLIF